MTIIPLEIQPTPVIIKDRLSVNTRIYHERRSSRDPIFELPIAYERHLDTFERVYGNHYVATSEWQPLKLGWVDSIGLLVFTNEEGKGLSKSVLESHKEILKGLILEIKYKNAPDDECFVVPPGEALPVLPRKPKDLVVRAGLGSVKYTLTVIPA